MIKWKAGVLTCGKMETGAPELDARAEPMPSRKQKHTNAQNTEHEGRGRAALLTSSFRIKCATLSNSNSQWYQWQSGDNLRQR